MDYCKISTTYLGVKVNIEFKGGCISDKKNAQVITDSEFVQDAIEHMKSFGKKVVLLRTIVDKVEKKIDSNPMHDADAFAEEKKPRIVRRNNNAAAKRMQSVIEAKGGKNESTDDDGVTIVDSVNNVNDAISYFQAKGESPMGEEDLVSLKEKYNVKFPNLK